METVYECKHSSSGEDSSCAEVLSSRPRESQYAAKTITIVLLRGAALQLHGSSPGLRNTSIWLNR